MDKSEAGGSGRFPDDELKARAAWHYYVEGLTQERISELLGIGRVKVHRVLTAAREQGVIQFRIKEKIGDCIVLEQKLRDRFGLRDVIVVPSAAEASSTPLLIGHAAATYLGDLVSAGDVVALGWGRTLKVAISGLPKRQVARTTVVSMLGGLTHAQPLNPTESAWDLAEKIGADCYLLPVPVYADEPAQRDAFMNQRSVQDVIFRARRANLVVLSVGSLSDDSPITNYGFIRPSEIEELKHAGAVGDILCYFVDAQGNTIEHDVNRRVCAFPLQDLSEAPHLVLVSGGRDKVAIMGAALIRLRATALVTDEDGARGLVGE